MNIFKHFIHLLLLPLCLSGCTYSYMEYPSSEKSEKSSEVESISSSSKEDYDPDEDEDERLLPRADEEKKKKINGNDALISGNYALIFKKKDDKYGIYLSKNDGSKDYYFNENPLVVNVTNSDASSDKIFYAPYKTITARRYGYRAEGEIVTDHGTTFDVVDMYYLKTDGSFLMQKRTSIKNVGSTYSDAGYETKISLTNIGLDSDFSNFQCFVPSILYRDNVGIPCTGYPSGKAMKDSFLFSSLSDGENYVKETRCATPLAMAYNTVDKSYLSIAHHNPEISCASDDDDVETTEININHKYGSIGFNSDDTNIDGVSVEYVYPCAEPNGYPSGSTYCYHPINPVDVQKVSVVFSVGVADSYNDAMTEAYEKAIDVEDIMLLDNINLAELYDNNILLFNNIYKSSGSMHGFPYQIALPNYVDPSSSSPAGFVGQHVPAAYNLYRTGLMNNNNTFKTRGKNIIDMWTTNSTCWPSGNYFPYVWVNIGGGANSGLACFLRYIVDCYEGIVDAYVVGRRYGENNTSWYNAIDRLASRLASKQNSDGSFYRAYEYGSGNVSSKTTEGHTYGDSKVNTPIAVRFFAKMYELETLLGNSEKANTYKTVAMNAANYCYEYLYQNIGKYIGGTCDNDNIVDKEASAFALYAFNAAYMLTKDEKWIKPMKHAACSVLSWTYTYDFVCPGSKATEDVNIYGLPGAAIGSSIIATGHSSVDNFSAYLFYEVYKTYLLTGDETYKKAAIFLQYDTKGNTNYDGRMKTWISRALCPEATTLANFSFSSACSVPGYEAVWLCWSGVANMEPLADLYDVFKVMDINSIEGDYDTQKNALNNFGIIGKLSK